MLISLLFLIFAIVIFLGVAFDFLMDCSCTVGQGKFNHAFYVHICSQYAKYNAWKSLSILGGTSALYYR